MYRTVLILIVTTFFLKANTIIHNATIYTVNEEQPYASAMVIKEGKIIYIGSNITALSYKNGESLVIDAKKRFVMPGIIDAHTHIAAASLLSNMGINLIATKGKKEILAKLQAFKEDHPETDVVTGFGFYPYAFGPKGPTKEILDKIFPDAKAFFVSNNGHQAWANSKALEFLGITKETPDPRPGIHYYVRNGKGEPTGFLVEGEAIWPHLKHLGIGQNGAFASVLDEVLPQLSAQGITALFDAAIPALEPFAFEDIRLLEKEGKLPLRYYASYTALNAKRAQDAAQELQRLQKKYDSPLLRVQSVKFINDNSDDDNYTILFSEDELQGYLAPIAESGLDVMIHTSRDRAVHEALNAIEEVKTRYPESSSRFTLAHVNMVRDEDFKRFKDLGVIANIQTMDAQGGGYYDYRYGLYGDAWRGKLARYNTFFKEEVITSGSSDYPSCNLSLQECSPFDAIEVGVTRQKIGQREGTVLPAATERLSVAKMIQAYTINAAYQLHAEKELGTLEIGKAADLIMLDQNPFESQQEKLHRIRPVMTMMGGKIVYRAPLLTRYH